MSRGMSGRSYFKLGHFLEGVCFPALREDLVIYAEDNIAPQAVIDILERLPDREFKSMMDILSGVGQLR